MRVVGHRGVRPTPNDDRAALPPENTLAAFARAADEGADAVEFDARLSATGEAVVVHDPDLARVTGGADRRRIREVAARELPVVAGERIPTLAAALELCAARGLGVNVELKYDDVDRLALARACAPLLARARVPVVASSFDPRVLAWLGALAPRVPRAWLVNATQRGIRVALRALARRPAFFAAHLERRLASPGLVATLRARGLRVGVWTVNDAREARDLFALGVDWIITDTPGVVCKVRA